MKKQSYQSAKKRITSELANVLKDPSVVIVSDWLKVRGTLRDWTKLWAILKPGLMLLYRNPPSKVCSSSVFFLLKIYVLPSIEWCLGRNGRFIIMRGFVIHLYHHHSFLLS